MADLDLGPRVRSAAHGSRAWHDELERRFSTLLTQAPTDSEARVRAAQDVLTGLERGYQRARLSLLIGFGYDIARRRSEQRVPDPLPPEEYDLFLTWLRGAFSLLCCRDAVKRVMAQRESGDDVLVEVCQALATTIYAMAGMHAALGVMSDPRPKERVRALIEVAGRVLPQFRETLPDGNQSRTVTALKRRGPAWRDQLAEELPGAVLEVLDGVRCDWRDGKRLQDRRGENPVLAAIAKVIERDCPPQHEQDDVDLDDPAVSRQVIADFELHEQASAAISAHLDALIERASLTTCETEALDLIRQGWQRPAIAERLRTARATVDKHLARALNKLRRAGEGA
jgi:DNA-binding CsgD family transcriptional regulator